MPLSEKQQFIQAFFDGFKAKVLRLKDLFSQSFEDEAFTLCLVYIDRLASGHYGGQLGQNRKNFWQVLTNLSGNPLFGMIHPRELLEQTKAKYPSAALLIESIVNRQSGALLKEDDLATEIKSSSLTGPDKIQLTSNLWRASMANICYDYIRNAEVHGPGSGGLSFDETIYQGRKGVKLDFDMLYAALDEILRRVADASIQTRQWFGNPKYTL